MHMTDELPPDRRGKTTETFGESRALEAELKRTIRGEVRFDDGSRALYATDASNKPSRVRDAARATWPG
jgi:hypothetical protein